jgi:type III secretion protein J
MIEGRTMAWEGTRDSRRASRSRSERALLVGAGLLALAACGVPVAGGLDETDANRIVVALDHAAIDATKESDPVVEGKFRVMVTRDDAARALVTMRSEDLPRPHTTGVMDTVDKGALVPSAAQEHAELVAGIAGDLARTLEEVDGVLAARVHLNVAAPDPLRFGPSPRTTASVLLEHRGLTPPLTEAAVARLVAGGVPDLAISDVAVVFVARAAAPLAAEAELRHVGPIAVARGSMHLLQATLAGLTLLLSSLAAATLLLWTRLRRARRDALDAHPPEHVDARARIPLAGPRA